VDVSSHSISFCQDGGLLTLRADFGEPDGQPQDLVTRYEGADIEPASLAAWRLFVEQLISSADPAIAFIDFLQTMQALPGRPLSQPRVFVSHRMADVPYAERTAWPGAQRHRPANRQSSG
jgi:hypothetical protein